MVREELATVAGKRVELGRGFQRLRKRLGLQEETYCLPAHS